MHHLTQSSLQHTQKSNALRQLLARSIREIDDLIRVAHDSSQGYIEYELDTSFGFTNRDNADAQCFLYSSLLHHYLDPEDEGGAGFTDVKIVRDKKNRNLFCVRWKSQMNQDEINARVEFIKNHTVYLK